MALPPGGLFTRARAPAHTVVRRAGDGRRASDICSLVSFLRGRCGGCAGSPRGPAGGARAAPRARRFPFRDRQWARARTKVHALGAGNDRSGIHNGCVRSRVSHIHATPTTLDTGRSRDFSHRHPFESRGSGWQARALRSHAGRGEVAASLPSAQAWCVFSTMLCAEGGVVSACFAGSAAFSPACATRVVREGRAEGGRRSSSASRRGRAAPWQSYRPRAARRGRARASSAGWRAIWCSPRTTTSATRRPAPSTPEWRATRTSSRSSAASSSSATRPTCSGTGAANRSRRGIGWTRRWRATRTGTGPAPACTGSCRPSWRWRRGSVAAGGGRVGSILPGARSA